MDAFLGVSPAAKAVRRDSGRFAATNLPVLIVGETGTGKELVARGICGESQRATAPFIAFNCAAIPDELLESELFGHARGAFTGATKQTRGLIGAAHQGTLFIDEVDSMPPRMQAALLRVLESGEYRAVGSSETHFADFRLLSAASPELFAKMDSGRFRQDLYYRISTLVIELPPLRNRREDVAVIAAEVAAEMGASLTDRLLSDFADREWRGNVRELVQEVQRAVTFGGNGGFGKCEGAHLATPDSVSGGLNRVDLRHGVGSQSVQEFVNRIVRQLPLHQSFSVGELCRQSGVSKRSVQRAIGRLVRLGVIRRVGAGRATSYVRCD